jgi:hypothetical protein
MRLVRSLVAWLVVLAAAGAASAAPGASSSPSPLARAEDLLRRAALEHDGRKRFMLADEAQALCEDAARASPRDPMPHIVLAQALAFSDPAHPESCRAGLCERAVEELRRARALDGASGGVEAERIASELGIVLSRLAAFGDALAEYDRALKLVEGNRRPGALDEVSGRAVLYGNSAETLMALGRLDEAIARYRQAELVASSGDLEWQLAQWGLGVALDRDEQGEKSRLAIQRALDHDPTMAHLAEEGVFFEPPGDKRYYEALGHEVAGDREQALAAWRDYLAAPAPRWARRARRHVEALEKAGPEGSAADLGRLSVTIDAARALREMRPPSVLRAEMLRHVDALKLCYLRARRSEPDLRGDMRLAIEVSPGGWVGRRAHVLTSPLESLSRCVELSTQSWRFPPVAGDAREDEDVLVNIRFDVFDTER